jgi:hypothetical protein
MRLEVKVRIVNKWVFTAYALCVRFNLSFALPKLRSVSVAKVKTAGTRCSVIRLGELLKYQP